MQKSKKPPPFYFILIDRAQDVSSLGVPFKCRPRKDLRTIEESRSFRQGILICSFIHSLINPFIHSHIHPFIGNRFRCIRRQKIKTGRFTWDSFSFSFSFMECTLSVGTAVGTCNLTIIIVDVVVVISQEEKRPDVLSEI